MFSSDTNHKIYLRVRYLALYKQTRFLLSGRNLKSTSAVYELYGIVRTPLFRHTL